MGVFYKLATLLKLYWEINMKDNPISINSLRSVKFFNIESSYTFEAKGVNIDYMLLVVLDNTSRSTNSSKIAIDKLHENIFAYIKKSYKDGSFGNDGLKVISYLRDSEIINISKSEPFPNSV